MAQMIRRWFASLFLIVLVALGVRAGFAYNQIRKIPEQFIGIVPFQTETGHIAYSLASGKGFASPFQRDTGPTAWLAPVYPLLVAAIFKLFGVYTQASFLVAVFLNIAFSAGTCIPVFYACKRVGGLTAASLAAWFWALFPNAILIPFEWIWDTSLAALLAATILWLTFRVAESDSWRDWVAYGLLWGFALMTNPALLSLSPVLLGWLIWRVRPKSRIYLRKPAIAVALAFLCCVPWTLRNFVTFHRFIPFRSNLSYELYIGNNENYDERHRGLPPVITQDRETLRYLRMGEMAFMDEEQRKALLFIKAHPLMELKLFAWRFVDFWIGVADPWATFLRTDSLLVRVILLGNLASALGALLGMVALFLERNIYAVSLAAFPVVFPFLYYLTHTSLRYRHPIDPVVLLLTAIAIHYVWGRFFPRSTEAPAGAVRARA